MPRGAVGVCVVVAVPVQLWDCERGGAGVRHERGDARLRPSRPHDGVRRARDPLRLRGPAAGPREQLADCDPPPRPRP